MYYGVVIERWYRESICYIRPPMHPNYNQKKPRPLVPLSKKLSRQESIHQPYSFESGGGSVFALLCSQVATTAPSAGLVIVPRK